MTDMSFLTILSLVSITVPGIARVIQNSLYGFISMDLLRTDRWLIPLIFSDYEADNSPLNPYFEENGFSSKMMI